MEQTFEDFEIVVVDDGSTDDTPAVLGSLGEARLRLLRHERNQGIFPARATAVEHARGEWFVRLDSDWELLPHSLARLRELIDTRPDGLHVIRSRMQWDDGHVGPTIMPATPITDYRGRLTWLQSIYEREADSDAGHCIHRSVYAETPYPRRRGVIDGLWELDLARRERSLWVEDVLARQHTDAANSYTRDAAAARLIPQLLNDATDVLWRDRQMIARHGAELARHAPACWRVVVESTALHAFLAGKRMAGIKYTWASVQAGAAGPKVWVTLILGLMNRRLLAYVKATGRQTRARIAARRQPAGAVPVTSR